MAEVLATMVVGPLVSMVKEKASSYLLDQYKVMEGMEEQHKLLKRKLPAILDVITDAEEQAAKNREGAKAWLEELRNVAYKANDVLDEFKYEALRRKAKAEGHYKEFGMDVIKLFPSHNRFVFRYRMANKLRMILQEIDVLIAEMNTFRFKFKPQPSMSMKWRQTDPNISDNSLISIASDSRAKEKDEIVAKLRGQGENMGLTVLPIVGMGGMGKTTLAQLVYNDPVIQKHFQLRLWVCVSENFDVNFLAERIVEEANKENGCKAEGKTALDRLQNAVSGKRYLLVLDDVWNREAYKWENLRSYLHHGLSGSSVVTTTRDKKIAEFMGTTKTHEIKGLGVSFIEDIIKAGAFRSQEQRPELLDMVGKAADRCSGSPLAATALGSVLRTKNTMQEWEAVLNRSTICDEETGILPILKLSYNCLPPHMRQCFAFCAMFPKDHKIDVEMLIRLWMANYFIPEQKGVLPEVIGQQIFNELAQRSFFQEVEQVNWEEYSYCSRITCKIHDLMHDVAQDSMGKECAVVDTKLSRSEDFPYTARHLFLSEDIPENILNASPEKGSLAIQTLLGDMSRIPDVQQLSKYCRSVRALSSQQGSILQPKYLHHLRYLDLSGSDMEAVSEEITILYHLQTLNLSYCRCLEQLPKTMKYMTGLRHLYTHGCYELKCMPPNLGHLTSLHTLTSFVLGTGSGCSNMGELEKLDLGGQLELRRLENATGADAKAAKLWDKKRLEELTLRWSYDHDKEADKMVSEGLRPHDGLKAMMMYGCGSSGMPTWMLELQGLVELKLVYCKNLEKLPALWQLPALKFLYLSRMLNLHCLFSGGAPTKFQKLKSMDLRDMPKFETWWDTNEVEGEEPLFPEVEYLSIDYCGSLTTLPKASVVKQSSGKDDTDECRSAFPELREMRLVGLNKFHRWEEAVGGTLGENVTFPRLEKLEIRDCSSGLTTFPEAPKLSTFQLEGCGEEASVQAASKYITSLSSLSLKKKIPVRDYPMRETDWTHGGSTYITSLSSLSLKVSDNSGYNEEENSMEVVVRDHESPLGYLQLEGCDVLFSNDSRALVVRDHESPLGYLQLEGCDVLFSNDSRALALWKCFGQLSQLVIYRCHGLVYWPENLFQGLVSLRTLKIVWCEQLTGHTEQVASDEQSALVQRSGTLPRLESLVLEDCESLVQVPNLSASLRTLRIEHCASLKSVVFGEQQEDGRLLVSGEDGGIQPAETSSSLIAVGSSSNDATLSTAALNLAPASSASSNHCFFPCLGSLETKRCYGLTEVVNLPPSIKTLKIFSCGNLVSLSEKVTSLEELSIGSCGRLEFLPNGPQVYSSLRVLSIDKCNAIKQLLPSLYLQQRLNHHGQEQVELDSKPESMSDGASTDVLKQSSSTVSNHCDFPCLEYLEIKWCHGLTKVANLPPSIKTLRITSCGSLISLSGEVPSLEELEISFCQSLKSLPNGPQVYSSLRVLDIQHCDGIKQLPPSLQQRLDHLEKKILDPHLLRGLTGRNASLMNKLECFRSRSQD